MKEKTAVYLEFVDIFVKTFDEARDGKPNQKKMTTLGLRLTAMSLSLIVLAPDAVVEKYLAWRAVSLGENPDSEETIKAFAEIIIAMRGDMVGDHECTIDTVLDALA